MLLCSSGCSMVGNLEKKLWESVGVMLMLRLIVII